MRQKMILALLIIGGLITTITAVVQYFEGAKKDFDSAQNEEKLNKKIDTLTKYNNTLSNQVAQLSKNNSNLSIQLAETTNKLYEQGTGGSKVRIDAYILEEDKFQMIVINEDKYTIYNALITVIDIDKLGEFQPIGSNEQTIIFQYTHAVEIFDQVSNVNLNVGGSYSMNKHYKFDKPYRNFQVEIMSRKNHILIQLFLRKENEKWLAISRTYEMNGIRRNKLIEEVGKVDEKYWQKYFFNNKTIAFETSE